MAVYCVFILYFYHYIFEIVCSTWCTVNYKLFPPCHSLWGEKKISLVDFFKMTISRPSSLLMTACFNHEVNNTIQYHSHCRQCKWGHFQNWNQRPQVFRGSILWRYGLLRLKHFPLIFLNKLIFLSPAACMTCGLVFNFKVMYLKYENTISIWY